MPDGVQAAGGGVKPCPEFRTAICDLLGIDVPILQGAMQGGGGVDLVAAVSEAGGLGVLATFGGGDAKLREDIAMVRSRTAKPFGVNIMPMGRGITERCVATCIELDVPVVTTGRADPGEDAVTKLKAAGIKVVSVIPTVAHAKRMEAEGVDAVVASGCEAGGHVGYVATMPLVPQVVDAVNIPVVAAGGIGDGRGFVAALALGACGIQMGTRFMATVESDLNAWGRHRLQEMAETDTLVTRALTGATVRAIATPEIVAYEKAVAAGAPEAELTALARAVRATRSRNDKEASRQAACGQIAGMIRDEPTVAALMHRVLDEASAIIGRLATVNQDNAGRRN
ncbi:MAG: nitronate monooxygenase [Hyphomicrobiaceae bacterium]|nr:nitronate monooxygenase [Hyphomicrobiaceae bacterium]